MIPEEIREALKNLWSDYVSGVWKMKISNDQIDKLIIDTRANSTVYYVLFERSTDAFGKTEIEKTKTWIDIIKGNYSLYFDKFPNYETIELDGQKFMV